MGTVCIMPSLHSPERNHYKLERINPFFKKNSYLVFVFQKISKKLYVDFVCVGVT